MINIFRTIGRKHIFLSGGVNRIGYIDAAKGFGIICVVIGHVAGSYLDNRMLAGASWLLNILFNATYCFHMPFFFLISGFVYYKFYFDDNMQPKYGKIRPHVLNLIFLYVFFSAIYGLFRMLFSEYTTGQTTAQDLLMIWAKPIAEYWYLYVLIILYLIFLIPRVIKQQIGVLFVTTFILCFFSKYLSGIWELGTITYYTFFFSIGILLARGVSFLKKREFVGAYSIVAVVLLTIFRGDVSEFSKIQIVRILIALGVSLGIWFLFQNVTVLSQNRFFMFCGRHCLDIYIIHGYFTAGNRTLLPLIGIHGEYMSIILNFVISLFIPFFVVWVMKKVRIYDYIFRLAYKLRGKRA